MRVGWRARLIALLCCAVAATAVLGAGTAAAQNPIEDVLCNLFGCPTPPPQPVPPSPLPPGGGGDERLKALGGTVRTASTGNRSERVKTVPIGKLRGAKRTVVMSLGPTRLGALRPGDRIYGTSEVEVSVCLKANPLHGGERSCVGRTYGYDPYVRAELVLTHGTKRTRGLELGSRRLQCAQGQPNRNHHCVLVIDDGVATVPEGGKLPCGESDCHLNLVLDAYKKGARSGHKLVVGAASDGHRVHGDKGRINAARFRPGTGEVIEPDVTQNKVRGSLPIAGEGNDVKERAIYSIAVPNLNAGDQLLVDGRLVTRIGMHSYNVFQRTGLVLSEGPRSSSRDGWPEKVGDIVNGQISEANGFNCTQGDSAHEDPCRARKVGVLEITRDAPKTLYVNLVAGMAAQADFKDRYRSGDRARIASGFLRVYRFPKERNDAPPPARD
ncbi:MAG TPA: hypothetical protein VHF58_10630 [Solirubrobacterales bacterium]|nr:hypothetical protein [Solirubrobacterales bacterium]